MFSLKMGIFIKISAVRNTSNQLFFGMLCVVYTKTITTEYLKSFKITFTLVNHNS